MRFRAYGLVQLTICDVVEKRNGLPDEGVCDVQHTVHSDELFVMRRDNRNGQLDEGVCNGGHTVHSDKLFVLSQENRNVSHKKMCVIHGKHPIR